MARLSGMGDIDGVSDRAIDGAAGTERPWPGDFGQWGDDALAEWFLACRADRVTVAALSDAVAVDLERAYRIQAAGARRRVGRGERRVGWKLGYTSQAMRAQMGIDSPNFGPLFDSMIVTHDTDVGDRFTQPKVEPEIAVVLAADVGDPGEVRRSIGAVHAALEIVDSVFTGYRFRLADNTADGSSAAGFILGPTLAVSPDRLAEVDVRFGDHASAAVAGAAGAIVGASEPTYCPLVDRATGTAASGDPVLGIEWLVARLAERGEYLRAGDVVLTGGLTAARTLAPGTAFSASFTPPVSGAPELEATVTVRRGDRPAPHLPPAPSAMIRSR